MKTTNNTSDWFSEKKSIKETYGLRHYPEMFNTLSTAAKWAEDLEFSTKIMLGDNGLFWLVTSSDARRLAEAGYEYAL